MIQPNELRIGNLVIVGSKNADGQGIEREGTVRQTATETVTIAHHDGKEPLFVESNGLNLRCVTLTRQKLKSIGFQLTDENPGWQTYERDEFIIKVSSQDHSFVHYKGQNTYDPLFRIHQVQKRITYKRETRFMCKCFWIYDAAARCSSCNQIQG